jgi:hypothetical protein
MDPIRPSVRRRARWNTALSVSAVRIATGEYQGCPPAVIRGSAFHAATASSVNQTVKLPRWRKAASYAAEFVSLCFCFGIWWRWSWFSLNGKVGIRGQTREERLLRQAYCGRQWAGPCNKVTPRIFLSFVRPSSRPFFARTNATWEPTPSLLTSAAADFASSCSSPSPASLAASALDVVAASSTSSSRPS